MYQLDAGAPGGAFGIAITASRGSVQFAAVDDDLNTVTVWTLHRQLKIGQCFLASAPEVRG
jgi:hypothetical protein